MRIIVPMAGAGKRLRPHTLTVPKPLLPVAGKPIVQRLVEDITAVCGQKVEEIAFVTGRFGEAAEKNLIEVAEKLGAKGSIYYQDEPLGTAHAVLCAADALKGNVIVAFADTLFRADFTLDNSKDGIIWVQQVANPSAFGVIKTDNTGIITDFIEKPKEFVSDLAIIGIYYFKSGENLRAELQHLIDNNIKGNNEFQLTDALQNMRKKGIQFAPGQVKDWLDCGNKQATVDANKKMLEYIKHEKLVDASATLENSVVIAPSFIGKNVKLVNSVVGPHASIGENCVIAGSIVSNSIVQTNATIKNANITGSMIGNYAVCEATGADLSIGDYTTMTI
ncbi:MAG TPA: sugar phosphate nucleotidyltransferase [Flavobacteriales bacterium]|nr:sugar phosphate nucleotidyltransferase [Flavobacteriales bacterium]